MMNSRCRRLAPRYICFPLYGAARCDPNAVVRPGNGAAQPYLPEALRSDPVLYPSADILSRGEWFAPQSASGQRLRDRLWTEIKT